MLKLKKNLHFHLQSMEEAGVDLIPPPRKTQKKHSPLSAEQALQNIRDEMGDCQRCPLYKTRTHLVFGEGSPTARLMFVGEAPGADEDLQGRPFVGRAGQLLTKMIEAMGLKREEIYIANILKSRPPNNRNPEPDEIQACIPFLKFQIEAIKPKVIVTLGKFAGQTLLQTEIPITKLRGEFRKLGDIQVMPTYHPAFLLRNPNMKKFVWEDLKKVMKELGMAVKKTAI